MSKDRRLHLGYNVLADGMHPAAWRAPYADPVGALKPSQWAHVAAVAERGTLDAIFLADSPSQMGSPAAGPGLAFDPTVLLSFLAANTERIGLIGTISSSFEEPYNLARRVASLDHLSGGRAAWNVVTTVNADAAANFSARGHLSREDRYARAEEFVDVVVALWERWWRCGRAGTPTRSSPIRPPVCSATLTGSGRSTTTARTLTSPARSASRGRRRADP
jgi:alkanesulfonate monooxygenase SsuD/methylene tetrahydromethanopterin reductase-like flavin-dependent oxidoreductase (luciferase family)